MGLIDDLKTSVAAAGRVAQTSFIFARNAQFFGRMVSDPGSAANARELREIFEQLGATYIKLGQFIASAPGIFPDAYVTEMQALLDRTTPVDFADLERTLKTELGEDYRSHFRSIEELPLASASIAQVHAAVLKDGQSVVLKNIFYDFDKFDLKDESMAELGKLISFLNKNPKIKIEVGGHTDNVGGKQYNQQLSEKRSKAVYDYLVQKGIAIARLEFKGYGDAKPVADNTTEQGRSQNRRTEFTIMSVN